MSAFNLCKKLSFFDYILHKKPLIFYSYVRNRRKMTGNSRLL